MIDYPYFIQSHYEFLAADLPVPYSDELVNIDYGEDSFGGVVQYQFNKYSYFVDDLKNEQSIGSSVNGKGSLGFFMFSVQSDFSTTEDLTTYFNALYGNSSIHFAVSSEIYECYVGEVAPYNGSSFGTRQVLEISESVANLGTASYVRYSARNFFGTVQYKGYFRVPTQYIPDDYIPPVIGHIFVEGNDIFWLYNFGSFLCGSSEYVSNLLGIRIGSMNLITVLFGGGFLVYASFIIVKWVKDFFII